MVGLTCCYVLLLKMVLIRAFVANPANVAITRFFCLFFTQKFTQKNRILAEILPKKLAAGGSEQECMNAALQGKQQVVFALIQHLLTSL